MEYMRALAEGLLALIDKLGYAGIALAIFAENIFPPIPSEIIMGGVGVLVARGQYSLWGAVAAGTLGATLSAWVFYAAGRWGGRPLLIRWGKYLRFTEKELAYADSWFERHGEAVVFFGRFIPIVRSLVSIPAGIARMPVTRFLAYTTVGSGLWLLFLTSFGFFLGKGWDAISEFLGRYPWVILIFLLAAGAALWKRKQAA